MFAQALPFVESEYGNGTGVLSENLSADDSSVLGGD
jgi:hypothetical protein